MIRIELQRDGETVADTEWEPIGHYGSRVIFAKQWADELLEDAPQGEYVLLIGDTIYTICLRRDTRIIPPEWNEDD